MPLPPDLQQLLRTNYLEYREKKAAIGRISPAMRARMNVMNSQLATRARISQHTLMEEMVGTMESRIATTKLSQRNENVEIATNALVAFLESGGMEAKAFGLKDELDWLGGYFITKFVGTKWVPGPLKKVDKAMSKTTVDYDMAWGNNKDLVRGTIACKSNEDLGLLANMIKLTCVDKHGMFLLKQDLQQSVRDGGTMGAGYSGWNFVVQFKEHIEFAAEMQLNTLDMLYGKMSKASYMKQFEVSDNDYGAMQIRLRFPGGLGHCLYDISDIARSGVDEQDAKYATELALDYYDACRGVFRNTTVEKIVERIKGASQQWKAPKAKELWHEGAEGTGWNPPIPT